MEIRPQAIQEELTRTIAEINLQIDVIKEECERQKQDPLKLRDTNGGFIMAPMLTAKAQCLNGLASIYLGAQIGRSGGGRRG